MAANRRMNDTYDWVAKILEIAFVDTNSWINPYRTNVENRVSS